jgi:hypothetical protein
MGNKAVSTGVGKIDPGKVGARPSTGKPTTGRPSTGQPAINNKVPTKSNQPNNIIADRDGNIYRKDDKGQWQQHNGGGWSNTDKRPDMPDARPSQRPSGSNARPAQRPTSPSGYNRTPNVSTSDYNRNRSNNRVNTYNRSAVPAQRPASRPMPAARGRR